MFGKDKRDPSDILRDMETGEEWSILDEDLMNTGRNNNFQRKELFKIGKRLRNFLKYKH